MARTSKDSASRAKITVNQPPALSPEDREQQLISLATALAEKQLKDGTASPSVVVHYLKLGTMREQEEREKLRNENELLKAKREAIQSAQRTEEIFQEALSVFKEYSGGDDNE